MAKRDPNLELPHTRRDDEAPPFKPIKALDDNITEWQKLLAKRKKIGQEINAQLIEQQELLKKYDRPSYPYEATGGGEREIFRAETVKSRKTKTSAATEPGKGKRGRAGKAGNAGDEASADE